MCLGSKSRKLTQTHDVFFFFFFKILVGRLLLEAYQKETNRAMMETPLIHFLQLAIEVRNTLHYSATW